MKVIIKLSRAEFMKMAKKLPNANISIKIEPSLHGFYMWKNLPEKDLKPNV